MIHLPPTLINIHSNSRAAQNCPAPSVWSFIQVCSGHYLQAGGVVSLINSRCRHGQLLTRADNMAHARTQPPPEEADNEGKESTAKIYTFSALHRGRSIMSMTHSVFRFIKGSLRPLTLNAAALTLPRQVPLTIR